MMNPPETDPAIAELWDEIPKVFGTARADVLMELAEHLMEAERHSEAVPVLETSQELYVEAGVDWMAGRVAHNLGVALGHLGREAEQRAAEQESIERFERAQRRDLAGCSRMSLGLHLRKAGRLKEALAAFRAAACDFADANEPLHKANALLAELEAEVDLGRFPVAARLLGPALHALAPVAPVASVARLHELAAQVFEVRNGPAAAQPILRRARAVWDALDDQDEVAKCDIRSAVLLIYTDRPEAAATTLQSLRPERQEAGDPAGVAACDHGLGVAALARKRPLQALRLFDDAATVFQAAACRARPPSPRPWRPPPWSTSRARAMRSASSVGWRRSWRRATAPGPRSMPASPSPASSSPPATPRVPCGNPSGPSRLPAGASSARSSTRRACSATRRNNVNEATWGSAPPARAGDALVTSKDRG